MPCSTPLHNEPLLGKSVCLTWFSTKTGVMLYKHEAKMNMLDDFHFKLPVPNCMETGSVVSETRCADANSIFIACLSRVTKNNVEILITRMNIIVYAENKSLVTSY
jgi:hypothetical protein